MRGSPRLPLRVAARLHQRNRRHDGGCDEGRGRGGATQRFRRECGFQHTQTNATVVFRCDDSLHAQLREPIPDIRRFRIAGFGGFPNAWQRAGGREVSGDALLEHALFFAEAELHLSMPPARFLFPHLWFLRQAERAFADQVLLNLRRAAADDEAKVQHVALLPQATVPHVRGCRGKERPARP